MVKDDWGFAVNNDEVYYKKQLFLGVVDGRTHNYTFVFGASPINRS
jgi:hypothetical protein